MEVKSNTHTNMSTQTVGTTTDLSLAVFADSHFRADPTECSVMPGPSYILRERTEKILAHAAAELRDIDLLLHNGDVVDRGDSGSYHDYDALLVQALPHIKAYYNVGNHDRGECFSDTLRMGEKSAVFEHNNQYCYTVEKDTHLFVCIDGTVQGDFLNAELGSVAREWLTGVLDTVNQKQQVWLFSHFPLFLQSEFLTPRNALRDGPAVHDILKMHADKIGAVFTAHVHKNYPIFHRDGIPYVSLCAASTPLQVRGRGTEFDPEGITGYHRLTVRTDKSFAIDIKSVPVDNSST
jgi:hypothetical protein